MSNKYFPDDPERAITEGCWKTEDEFIMQNMFPAVWEYDKSGSCCVLALLINDWIYVGNIGDSWALLYENDKMVELTRDHKPCREDERKRVVDSGG